MDVSFSFSLSTLLLAANRNYSSLRLAFVVCDPASTWFSHLTLPDFSYLKSMQSGRSVKQAELTWDVWIVVLCCTASVHVPEKLLNILLIQTAAVSNPGSLVAAKSNS